MVPPCLFVIFPLVHRACCSFLVCAVCSLWRSPRLFVVEVSPFVCCRLSPLIHRRWSPIVRLSWFPSFIVGGPPSFVVGCPSSFVHRGPSHSSWVVPHSFHGDMASSTRDPPCEQWLAAVGVGAGFCRWWVVGGGVLLCCHSFLQSPLPWSAFTCVVW
jgi:hypothetical protein